MAKDTTSISKPTRGDKVHKKYMDKLAVFKEGMTHCLDSFTVIHKQTLDAYSNFEETISKCQEPERTELYEIIKMCEDEERRKEAWDRLRELDGIKDNKTKEHNKSCNIEREKVYKNIAGSLICLGVATKVFNNKQVRQATGKALTTVSKNLHRLK